MKSAVAATVALAAFVFAGTASAEAPPAPPHCGPVASTSHSNATSTPIADGLTTSTIEVSGAGAYLTDVDLVTDLHHTFSSDLDITLMSPAGTVVTITTDNGGSSNDEFAGTTFDDQANPGGQVPYFTNTGVVSDTLPTPDQPVPALTPEEPLAAFHGEDPNGTWTLTIFDDLGADSGTLESWRLDIQGLPTAPPTSTASAANDTAVAVPSGPAVVTSTIDVAGAGAHLSDLDLWLDLPHGFPGDLDVTLMSPAGTIVTITTDNGRTFDNVFAGTTFDDQSNPGGQVPYSTNPGLVTDRGFNAFVVVTPLTPEEPLAAFDGEDPNGTWALTISDDDDLDGGELRSWRLDLTTGACPPPPAKPKPVAAEQPSPVAPAAPATPKLRVAADRLSVLAGADARCRGAQGTCRVRVIAGGRVIARGSAGQVRVPLRLTRAGRRLLAARFGGVRARVVASDGTSRARARTRAILAVERITTPPGVWLADQAALTPAGQRFVRRLHARLVAVKELRCDGYTAMPEGDPRPDFAVELSTARAALVCGDGARLVGHGSADPVVSNSDEAGRAANRRVEITVHH